MKCFLPIYMVVYSLLVTPFTQALIGPATTIDGSAIQTFSGTLRLITYHKPSGTILAGVTAGAGDNALSYAPRPASIDTVPTFTGIAGSTILSNKDTSQLIVITNPASPASFTSAYIMSTTATAPTTVCVITATAQNNNPQSRTLTDASNTAVTGKILSLAGGTYNNTAYGFAAIKTNGATTNFAAGTNDALSLITINPTTLAVGSAALLTRATTAVGVFVSGNDGAATGNVPVIVYDEILGRLYVGLNQIVSGGTAGNAATSVGMYSIDDTVSPVVLTNIPMSGNASSGTAPLSTVFNNSGTSIIGATSAGSTRTLSVNKLGVMHTSTKPAGASMNYAYLIVNGGNNTTTLASNQVYALPLVVNNGSAFNNGKLADVTNPGIYPFDTPANTTTSLYTSASAPARVGNGVLPATTVTNTVTSMWVDGDTVYCNVLGTISAVICTGVWKSQAVFDDLGRIVYWTDWEKVTPRGYSSATNSYTSVQFCAVDAVTGQIWGNFGNKLYVTGWTNSRISTDGLVGFINSTLSDGCFSVLDMNASVTGWGASTSQRMALFGGLNTVCFAITGSATYGPTTSPALSFTNGAASSLTNTATTVFTSAYLTTLNDYTATNTNIGLVTTGLPGRVNCLGYTGWSVNNASNTTPAFFLAGVQPQSDADGGLYVYATVAGRGFNPVTDITDLKNGFFLPANNNSWQKLSSITGTPVKIMSRGGALYVLSQSVNDAGQRTDYIFRATLTDTVTNLNNSFRAIATTGVAPSGSNSSLAAATRFYDFMITSTVGGTTAVPTGAEQLMVLTDDGIYTTTCADGTQTDYGASTTDLTLQLNAGWVQIPGSDEYIEMMVSEPDRQRNPHTFWYASFISNADTSYYNSQVMTQLNSNYTGATGTFTANPAITKPGIFNSNSTTSFARLPLMRSIYSDGSRRFFVQTNIIGQEYLTVLPYNVEPTAWNVIDPVAPLVSSAFVGVTAYYWMALIGSTGCLMAGTNTGVVSLQ